MKKHILLLYGCATIISYLKIRAGKHINMVGVEDCDSATEKEIQFDQNQFSYASKI